MHASFRLSGCISPVLRAQNVGLKAFAIFLEAMRLLAVTTAVVDLAGKSHPAPVCGVEWEGMGKRAVAAFEYTSGKVSDRWKRHVSARRAMRMEMFVCVREAWRPYLPLATVKGLVWILGRKAVGLRSSVASIASWRCFSLARLLQQPLQLQLSQ